MLKWDKIKIDIKKGADSFKTGMKKVVKQAVTEVDVLKLKYEREKVKESYHLFIRGLASWSLI